MLKSILKISFVLIGALMLAGCSIYRIDSQDTTPDYYPPRKSSQEVYYQEKMNRPFEIVGSVMVSVENGRSFDEVLARMRGEAALLGGDVITGVIHEPEGVIRTRYTAKVAVFK